MHIKNGILPRGIRNNNPGNIRKGEDWRGMSEVQDDPDFITFKEYKWGLRAMYKVLRNYKRLHGINTIEGVINRWAPPNENDTHAYIEHVAKYVGVHPKEEIDLEKRDKMIIDLMKVIIKHENANVQPYTDTEIKDAINLA